MIVIGLMSGTSYDGIDAAAVDIRSEGNDLELILLGSRSRPYPEPLRAMIAGALPPKGTTMEAVCRLDTMIGREFAELAAQADGELCHGAAELVVSHGQTLFHWVEDGRVEGTLQLGQPAWIAERTGLPVVSDLRSRDVAAGGQGAPLVALVDLLWLAGRAGRPVALNLGGIGNATVPGHGDEPPLAFDTGPANALIDLAAGRATDGRLRCDVDGRLAASGRVRDDLLARLLDHSYFARRPPKSTGKELFHAGYLDDALAAVAPVAPHDLVATATEFTAATVADALAPYTPTEVIVAGGGVRNPTLMDRLAARLAPAAVRTSDELGLPSADKEAYAFALLGYLTVHGVPGTVPSCTGADRSSLLGTVTPGRVGLPTPADPSARSGVLRPPPSRLRVRATG